MQINKERLNKLAGIIFLLLSADGFIFTAYAVETLSELAFFVLGFGCCMVGIMGIYLMEHRRNK